MHPGYKRTGRLFGRRIHKMYRVFFAVLCSIYIINVQSLECGISDQINKEGLQEALHKCAAPPKAEAEEKNETMPANESTSSEETTSHSTSRSRRDGSRTRREVNATSTEDDAKAKNGSDSETSKCVLQCVFSELGMVDANGFPEHHKIADTLMKNAKGRELRDFIQDSTDECFQLMQQGEKPNSCDFATNLVSCLAEKGKSNCADWQIMKLPYQE